MLKTTGQFDKALACFDHVIQAIDPENKRALHNKANTLVARSQNDSGLTEDGRQDVLREAVELLDKALEMDPRYEKAIALRERLLQIV